MSFLKERLLSPSHDYDMGKNSNESHRRLREVAFACAKKGLCINIWSVSSLETDQTNIGYLEPLSTGSGGSITKTAMNNGTPQIRAAFSEKLKRALGNPRASKCTFKLRASPIIAVDAVMGHIVNDEELIGVQYMGGCAVNQALATLLSYESSLSPRLRFSLTDDEERRSIVLQVAFSYDTLVEADESLFSNYLPDYIPSVYATGLDKPYADYLSDCLEQIGIPCPRSSTENLYYNFKHMLVSVRRLRIITKVIECTHDVPELMDCMNSRVVAAIMVKRAVSMTATRSFSRDKKLNVIMKSSCCRRGLEAAYLIEKWTFELVASTLKYYADVVSVGRRARINKYADKTEYVKILDAIARRPVVHQLLKYIFGSLVLFTNGSTILNRFGSIQYMSFSNDEFVDLCSSLSNSDFISLSSLLYPRLLPVDSNFILKSTLLCLRRQAMVAIPHSTLFVMDAGTEVIVYQSIPPTHLSNPDHHMLSDAVKKNDRYVTSVLDRMVMRSSIVPVVVITSAGRESANSLNMRLLEDATEYNDFINAIKVRALDLVD